MDFENTVCIDQTLRTNTKYFNYYNYGWPSPTTFGSIVVAHSTTFKGAISLQ
jgi:hypothetical protein